MDFAGKNIHFVGIGGVSMGALAKLAGFFGAHVTGSDLARGGHNAANIHSGIDFVVYNGAIADDNPEVLRAKQLGIPVLGREELLARIESKYTNRIAVAGAHGKSTTTAMIGAVLVAGGKNPTVHNGAMPNLVIGGMEYFVTEACEFKRSFLKLAPTVAVITNIDADHLDCYNGIDEIRAVYAQFAAKSKTVFSAEDFCAGADGIEQYERGKYSFRIHGTTIKLGVVGRHNVDNALAAVAVGRHIGVEMPVIKAALEGFTGIKRRFEYLGKVGNCDLISDYAHHPAEIETTIRTAGEIYGSGRFLIVFQPHTFTRTLALFDDFVNVLKKARVVLYKTYSARERPQKGGTGRDLARSLGRAYFARPQTLSRFIARASKKYNAIIVTGAGDIQDKIVDICRY